MFTVEQIERTHDKVKSGADFPKYIQEIKQMGVIAFETWVVDSHTVYFGRDDFRTQSQPQYGDLNIAENVDSDKFAHCLKIHQQGQTNYRTFCNHCAETGIEKWVVDLETMTCTYFDRKGNVVLTETIPG